MTPSSPDPTCCTIAIGNIAVALRCDHAPMLAALGTRYHAFATDRSPDLIADIRYHGAARTASLLDTQLTFDQARAYFTAAGYQGVIDPQARTAQLELASDQPLAEIEYFVRVVYALLAFETGGLLFHAAGVVRHARAFLFFGYSGSGKTTVARLSPHDLILNDDLVLLLPHHGQWWAHATPFSNPTQVQPTGPHRAPLAALLRLVQNTQVFTEAISYGQALAEVIANTPIISADAARSARLFERAAALVAAVPPHRLHFLPDDSFWPVVEAVDAR